MKKYTTEQLEAAFEFISIANERGGYVCYGDVTLDRVPHLPRLIEKLKDYTHLPLPPKKVMMQMFRYGDSLTLHAVSASLSDHYNYDRSSWEKIGEPFEFVFPEEVK